MLLLDYFLAQEKNYTFINALREWRSANDFILTLKSTYFVILFAAKRLWIVVFMFYKHKIRDRKRRIKLRFMFFFSGLMVVSGVSNSVGGYCPI